MLQEVIDAVEVFISYAHEDKELSKELEQHLSILKRRGLIRAWKDRSITAGSKWEAEILQHLESAGIILLLVSSAFIDSDYCWDIEMTRALARHQAGKVRVIPIILRSCHWQSSPFGELQTLPQDGKAVTGWTNRDDAFLNITQGIEAAVKELQGALNRASVSEPVYTSTQHRDILQTLKALYRRRAGLLASNGSTEDIDSEIVGLKRKRRLLEGPQLQAGDFLLKGRFELEELIGQGGFAQVWKTYDNVLEIIVAVKVLHAQHSHDRSRRDRFFRGARHMARLNHPRIVRVIEEHCVDGEHHFFVMEYAVGGDLRAAVLSDRITCDEGLQILNEVGTALQYAHENGVIHRDVKPANVLLDGWGRPKLTDFDLVRAADTTGGTRTAMLGTFLYAAPEAFLDAGQAGVPADVYGMGMTALFVLYGSDLPGELPWVLPEFLAQLNVNEARRATLARAVARKPEERWTSVAEFLRTLASANGHIAMKPRSDKPAAGVANSEAGTAMAILDGKPFTEPLTGELFLPVPAGRFQMGTTVHPGEQPIHWVCLSSFWLARTPVTNRQYRLFLDATRYEELDHRPGHHDAGPDQPVVGVSWEDALAYCNWLSEQSPLGGKFSLPTEAQWEYTARGADGREYPWGNEKPSKDLACFGLSAKSDYPAPVGSYPKGAGPFGHLDLAGNVWEWCLDLWEKDYQRWADFEPLDPVGEADSRLRSLRGGGWWVDTSILRSSYRLTFQPGDRFGLLGFRLSWSPSSTDS